MNHLKENPLSLDPVRQAPVFALIPSEADDFFPPSLRAKVQEAFPHSVWLNPEDVPREQLESASILVGAWRLRDIPLELLKSRGGNLEYLCLLVGSPKRSITREHIEEGLLVSNWGNTISPIVAEGAIALILSRLRKIPYYNDELVNKGLWNNVSGDTATLFGKRVSIHGFGNLARALIPLLRPFNVSISVHAPGVPVELIEAEEVRPISSLEELAHGCEVFIEAEALRPDNFECINRQILSRLPRGCLFINIARGALVNEADLIEVAGERELKVALDVYQQEPLPRESPLFDIPDALLIPHMCGPTKDARRLCGELALENLKLYLGGQEPKNVIGLQDFDRIT